MFVSLLSPVLNAIYPCSIEEVRASVQKEKRIIDTLEPLMNQHRLVMDYSNLLNDVEDAQKASKGKNSLYYSLLFQMTHITKDRNSLMHDDKLDTLAMGVAYWNEYGILKQNTDDALEMYKKKQLEGELNRRRDVFSKMTNKTKVKTRHGLTKFRGYSSNLG